MWWCFSLWLVQISNYCNEHLEGHFLTFCDRYYRINTSDFLAKGVCCFRLKRYSFGCFWQNELLKVNVNISTMSLLTHCISTLCPISSANITRTLMRKFQTCMENKIKNFVWSYYLGLSFIFLASPELFVWLSVVVRLDNDKGGENSLGYTYRVLQKLVWIFVRLNFSDY